MFKQLQAELALAHNIHFNDVSLLEEALTQANYINEHPNYTGRDYQRLEFLGMRLCNNQRRCTCSSVIQIGMKVD